jgi:hypothetical protein
MIQAKTCIVNLKNIPIGFVLRKGGFEITDCDFKSSLIQNRTSIYVPSEPVTACDQFRFFPKREREGEILWEPSSRRGQPPHGWVEGLGGGIFQKLMAIRHQLRRKTPLILSPRFFS